MNPDQLVALLMTIADLRLQLAQRDTELAELRNQRAGYPTPGTEQGP